MRGRCPAKLKRPPAHRTIDLKKLVSFRCRRGLTLAQVQELTGIPRSTLCDFEKGRIVLNLHKIKVLVELYELDFFEVLELLRFRVLHPSYIRLFDEACQRSGCAPREALENLIVRYYLENSSVAQHMAE
jgi:hypothetical protein